MFCTCAFKVYILTKILRNPDNFQIIFQLKMHKKNLLTLEILIGGFQQVFLPLTK